MIDTPCTLTPQVRSEVEQLALKYERSIAYIVRKLISKGLVAYNADGFLESALSNRPDIFFSSSSGDVIAAEVKASDMNAQVESEFAAALKRLLAEVGSKPKAQHVFERQLELIQGGQGRTRMASKK